MRRKIIKITIFFTAFFLFFILFLSLVGATDTECTPPYDDYVDSFTSQSDCLAEANYCVQSGSAWYGYNSTRVGDPCTVDATDEDGICDSQGECIPYTTPEPECECDVASECCDGCDPINEGGQCNVLSYDCCFGEGVCGGEKGERSTWDTCEEGYCAGAGGNSGCLSLSPRRFCPNWAECTGTANCNCEGDCLERPSLQTPNNGAEKIKLPVTLRWDSVAGANSYRYQIEGVNIPNNVTTTNYVTIKNCILNSSSTYNWRVQACCSLEGDNCGDWNGYWSFETSLAPELLSPENNAEDVVIPATFDWCEAEDAQSYCVQVYREGETTSFFPPYFPWLVREEGGTLKTEFTENLGLLAKDTAYEWQVASCINENGTECGKDCTSEQNINQCHEYSQKWSIVTGGEILTTPEPNHPLYNPSKPNEIPIVNFSSYLGWGKVENGVFSYRYEIINQTTGETVPFLEPYTPVFTIPFSDLWVYLDPNVPYSWHVKSCWDFKGEECEEDWSEPLWKFKTTGAPPQLNSPTPHASDVPIPIELNWGDVTGAKSYRYEVYYQGNQIFEGKVSGDIPSSEISIEYDSGKEHPKTKTTYSWRVRSCADEEGDFCGRWNPPEGSPLQEFETFELPSPTNPDPEDGGTFLASKRYLRWKGATKYYQYKVDYQGEEKIPLTPVSGNSAFIPTGELELGEYTWWVQSCLDSNCQETSEPAGPWLFTLVQQEECEKGLIPCGRDCDVLETASYNERDPCEFKHVFLLLNNILDFVLWQLGLIILVLLAIATGVIYYFSMGAPQTMVKVKSLLKSAGMGYGIIFLGWLIVNWILVILGYQVGVFGRWWQIIF